MNSLPQELIDVVLDLLKSDGHNRALKACALTARFLRPGAQVALFRSLRVYPKTSFRGGSAAQAVCLLKGSPHIAPHVRRITVRMSNADSEDVGTLLKLTVHLERLVVSGRSMAWSELHESTKAALVDCLAYPSLTRFHLLSFRRVPAAFILKMTMVQAISFYRVIVDPDYMDLIPNGCFEGAVSHLIMFDRDRGLAPIVDLLLQPKALPSLRAVGRLALRMDPMNAGTDSRLLAACASTLRDLVLDPGALVNPMGGVPCFPLLQTLEVKVFVNHFRRLPSSLPAALSSLTSCTPALKTLKLVFVIEPLWPEKGWPETPILAPFDESFGKRTCLLDLRCVHCKLVQRNTFGLGNVRDLFGYLEQAMQRAMPGLQGTGILLCTITGPPLSHMERLPWQC